MEEKLFTIWMIGDASGQRKFITPLPDKEA